MSYILEALKKAEVERARGNLPGLHTPVVATTSAQGRTNKIAWSLTSLALLVLCALLWRWLATPVVATTPISIAAVSAATNSDIKASIAATAPTADAAPNTPVATSSQTTSRGDRDRTNQPPALQAAPKQASEKGVLAPAVISAAKPISPVQAAPSSLAKTPAVQLPTDLKLAFPNLVINGSTYSDNPALRMLIINGEIFREGSQPAPGLRLEQIRQNSALLKFKEQTFSVSY
jgi:general secretion pathway protein B